MGASVGAALALAACQKQPASDTVNAAQANAASVAPDPGAPLTIPCATGGTSKLAPGCTVDRAEGPQGSMLTIRNPNGGFRRFLIVKDGRGLIAADGSEKAEIRVSGPGQIDVMVGGDSYRLPATLKGAAGSQP